MRFLFLSGEQYPNPYISLDLIFNHYLPQRGLQPIWVMPGDVAVPKKTLWRGNPLYLIPRIPSSHPLYFFRLRENLKRVLREIDRVSLVWVRDNPVMAMEGYSFAKKRGIPFVYRISHLKEEESILYAKMGILGSRWRNYIRGIAGKALRERFLKRADLVVATSKSMGDYFRSSGLKRVVVLPDGIDGRVRPEDYPGEEILEKYSLRGRRVVSYIGVLSPFRSSHFMLEVLKLLPEDFVLVLAGWGRPRDYPQWLMEKAGKMGLSERVKFLGFLGREEVYRLIRASSVGLSPFPMNPVLVHNSPIKPLEYLLMGRPVVSTPVPDTVEVLSLCGGGEVCPWDPECFARSVLSLSEKQVYINREKLIEMRDFANLAGKIHEEISVLI